MTVDFEIEITSKVLKVSILRDFDNEGSRDQAVMSFMRYSYDEDNLIVDANDIEKFLENWNFAVWNFKRKQSGKKNWNRIKIDGLFMCTMKHN